MKIIFALFFLMGIGLVGCNKKQPTLTREEVIAVIRRFDEGWKNKDLQTVDSVLAPSYIYFTQSGGIFERANLVYTAGSSDYTLDSCERNEYFVKLYENTAVVSTKWRGRGIYKGIPFNENQRCSLTIVKLDDKVKILTEHCTPIRPNRIIH